MRFAGIFVVLLCVWGLFAQQERPKPRAIVTYTDGTTLKGLLSTPDEGPLRIYDIKKRRYIRIALEEIMEIRFEIEKKEMKEAWRWREAGKPDKVFLGKKYPWVKLVAFVRLRDARLLLCHIAAQLYLTTKDGEDHRIRLLTYIKGKYGQNFSDLRWVSLIKFPDAKPLKPSVLEGGIEPVGVVRAIYAVRQGTGEVFCAKLSKDASSFSFYNLLPGVYDLVVVTDHQVRFGLGILGEKRGKEALDDDSKRALLDYINSIEEFCEEKMVVRVEGSRLWCRVFIRKVRRRRAHGEKERGEAHLFVEWEFAWLARVGSRWHIVRRTEIFRESFPAHLESDRLREPVFDDSLSDIDMRNGGTLRKKIKIGGGKR